MAIRALAKSPHLGQLRRLSFEGYAGFPSPHHRRRLRLPGLKALADSTCLPNLRDLDLSAWMLSDVDADLLAASGWMGQLYALRLKGNLLGGAARRRLRKCFGHRLHL
jgi:hypothetical protein